ncbi:MAG: hypothetical protein KDA24_23495 [Deltaproteobacteria bacterium]|nr:hypothetical protein [Deltaproteobacteria bacterium]
MLAISGAAVVIGCLALYLLYSQSVIASPRLARALRPLLGAPRRIGLILGVVMALAGVVVHPEGASLVAGLAAALGMRHATRRQWAFGLPATPVAVLEQVDSAVPVVALPDGRGVPVHWLERVRLARLDDVIFVACSISRSAAAFRAPPSGVLVQFPLDVGFGLGRGALWSGASGASLDGGDPLELLDLEWTQAGAVKQVFGPVGGALPDPKPPRTVRVRGADTSAGTEVVTVQGDAWRPMGSRGTQASSGTPRRYLAKWAAELSGLAGDSASDQSQ